MSKIIPEQDIIDKKLFQVDAVGPDLHEKGWEYMRAHNVKIHTALRTVPYKSFPPIVNRTHIGGGTVIAPRSDWTSILIPFSPLECNQKHFNGQKISDILLPMMTGIRGRKKFISSARSWYFFFAEMDSFEFDIFYNIGLINGIIPFILFDETLSYCFGFDFDFEYSFFSSPNLMQDENQLHGTFAEWDTYFVDNFVKKAPQGTYHLELFETILRPSINRILSY